ncbi:MAG TPA: hypothetical protein VFF43_08640, partial [Caldimonas sp.]|nr:hypothetical protein [Caldimonas sp.]
MLQPLFELSDRFADASCVGEHADVCAPDVAVVGVGLRRAAERFDERVIDFDARGQFCEPLGRGMIVGAVRLLGSARRLFLARRRRPCTDERAQFVRGGDHLSLAASERFGKRFTFGPSALPSFAL